MTLGPPRCSLFYFILTLLKMAHCLLILFDIYWTILRYEIPLYSIVLYKILIILFICDLATTVLIDKDYCFLNLRHYVSCVAY